MGVNVSGCSRTELKSFIEVPNVVQVKVLVFSFNMILFSSPWRVFTPSYPFRKDLGDKVKVSSPKKLNILTEVP